MGSSTPFPKRSPEEGKKPNVEQFGKVFVNLEPHSLLQDATCKVCWSVEEFDTSQGQLLIPLVLSSEVPYAMAARLPKGFNLSAARSSSPCVSSDFYGHFTVLLNLIS